MRTKVNWNEELYQNFVRYAMLSQDYQNILRMRIMEFTMTEIAEETGWSLSTVKRRVESLLRKYDEVQVQHPDIFPPKRLSVEEQYMDTH